MGVKGALEGIMDLLELDEVGKLVAEELAEVARMKRSSPRSCNSEVKASTRDLASCLV